GGLGRPERAPPRERTCPASGDRTSRLRNRWESILMVKILCRFEGRAHATVRLGFRPRAYVLLSHAGPTNSNDRNKRTHAISRMCVPVDRKLGISAASKFGNEVLRQRFVNCSRTSCSSRAGGPTPLAHSPSRPSTDIEISPKQPSRAAPPPVSLMRMLWRRLRFLKN